MPESQYNQLKRVAKAQDRPMASVCRDALEDYFGSVGIQPKVDIEIDWDSLNTKNYVFEAHKPQAEEMRAEAKRLGISLEEYCRQVLEEHIAESKKHLQDRETEDWYSRIRETKLEPLEQIWGSLEQSMTRPLVTPEAPALQGEATPPGFEKSERSIAYARDHWKSYIDGVHDRQKNVPSSSIQSRLSQAEIDRRLNEMWA